MELGNKVVVGKDLGSALVEHYSHFGTKYWD